jgi:electron transfer flavoprotein alpha subunit
MAEHVLVIVEHEEGKVRRGSLEALAVARRIAEKTGGRALAAVVGQSVADQAADVAKRGADEVYTLEHDLLATYTPEGYQVALAGLVDELSPEWVLMGHTYMAQDLLPRVSARFEAPVVSDCVEIELDGDEVVFHRQPYDAKFIARTVDRGPAPHFATLQSGAFSPDELPEDHGGQVSSREVQLSPEQVLRRVQEVRAVGDQSVDLSSAEFVVAGGRGLKSQENFDSLIKPLAEVLGAGIGASRPVVDSEWLPHAHQVGSSGQAIAPKLYIAAGVSGAIQHMVGCRSAQVIVAINKDEEAPIFNEATYGIVGDVSEILPVLTEAVKEAKSQ